MDLSFQQGFDTTVECSIDIAEAVATNIADNTAYFEAAIEVLAPNILEIKVGCSRFAHKNFDSFLVVLLHHVHHQDMA